jgi:cell cycle protein
MFKFFKISDRKGLITYFLIAIIVLSFIGILNQFSLSVPEDLKNSIGTKFYTTSGKHIFFVAFGLFSLWIVLTFKIDLIDKLLNNDTILTIFSAFSILTVVFVPFIGKEVNGARRWFDFKIFNFQPSEFLKIFIILFVAVAIQISAIKRKNKKRINIYIISLIFISILCGFIYISHALSSALQIMLILLCMYAFYDGIPYIYVLGTGVMGLLFGGLAIVFTSYRKARLQVTEQALLSLRSIARGGLKGAGYQEGLSRSFYLPEVQTDYVFSGFTEEWGFAGFIFLLFLLVFLVSLLFYAANFTKTLLEKMVLIGTAVMILNQTLLHMLINLSVLPSTGVTLPFLSYGGTSTVVIYIMLSICLSIMLKFNDYLEV